MKAKAKAKAKLSEYGLEQNFDLIKSKSRPQWKKEVETAVDSINREKLRDQCYETKAGVTKAKTKTAFLIKEIDSEHYKRDLMEPIQRLNRYETKVLMLSRFHMLECGKNFKGSLPEICPSCDVTDDEQHRLNHCIRFKNTNLYDSPNKTNFDDIYSDDFATVQSALNRIDKVWNLKTGHGCMVQTV